MPDSPYRISVEEFDRRTPKVHARPVDPDDPDGEMSPATAFAMVEQPEPPPNPNTVEGFIAGIGQLGTVGSNRSTVGRHARFAQRWLLAIVALPFVIAVVAAIVAHR